MANGGWRKTAVVAPPFVICHLSSVICHLPFVICHLPFAICHLPSVICHLRIRRPTISRFDPAPAVPGDRLWNRVGGGITINQVTPATRRVS